MFEDQLKKQLLFLQNSCDLYDRGQEEEAVRIATVLRVLFHQTKNSTSLMTHLGKGRYLELLSTCTRPSATSKVWLGLARISVRITPTAYVKGVPFLDDPLVRHNLDFDAWWNTEAIVLTRGRRITRKQLVLWAADKDGGAHVDEILPTEYLELAKFGLEITLNLKGENAPPLGTVISSDNIHFASIRQIGHEVLKSPEITKLIS